MIDTKDTVNKWLMSICFGVFLMVLVGGITRLTGSGLSMVTWKPIRGILPPLTNADWTSLFTAYQASPQFQKVTTLITLSEFKSIFIWEYVHRLMGRMLGLLCVLPYLYFWVKNRLDYRLKWGGGILILLVGCQGVVGWWMVKSGLIDNPFVSHFRLAVHLLLAYIILGWGLYCMRAPYKKEGGSHRLFYASIGILLLFLFQVLYGAFMSGLKAGYIYNTWPKMGTEWVPNSIWLSQSTLYNLLHNPFMVQFIHRSTAIILVLFILLLTIKILRNVHISPAIKSLSKGILSIVLIQFCLGVITLLGAVPIILAVLHQLTALVLFGLLVLLCLSLFRIPNT